jgi:MYXO-CTERM domain-containing protein
MLLLWGGTARAAEFYVDPAAGSASGDGSMASPWQTLEAVVQAGQFGKAIHAGDTVWLRTGYHGAFPASGGTYAPPITVAAAPGQTPRLSRVSFAQTHGWVVSGLSISPSHAPSPQVGTMVQVDKASSDVVVKSCDLFSVPDASAWGATEWINSASSAFQVSGDRITISNNSARNVRFGISVDGPNALIESNQIVNFSADGLRGLGDFGVFQYNLVKNVYVDDASGDTNHDDGFQSWSVGAGGVGTGVVTGVVLRGNYFLNREEPSQKLPNAMQGIGCFDGLFDGWVVENNVVVTDHWHGISFYGMKNSRIVNNTVIDVNSVSPGPPWIMVTPHKDGRASENVLIRNNLATDFDLTGTAIVQDHNTTLTNNLAAYFVDPTKFDLHLLRTAPAVDTGSPDQAPPLDADRIARPQGPGVDLGAYEWHDPSVKPDAGADAGGSGGAGGTGSSGAAGSGVGGMDAGGKSGAGGSSTGGSSGAAGSSTGGSSGAGGSSTGGSSGSGNSGTGGSSGSGNSGTGGSGGAGGSSGAGTSGAGGATGVNDAGSTGGAPGSSSGCSCGIGRHRSAAGPWWWMAALFLFGPWRRRTQHGP